MSRGLVGGKRARRGLRGGFLLAFLPMAAAIMAAGLFFHNGQARRIMSDQRRALSAIVDLKISEIETWRRERWGDARLFADNPLLTAELVRFLRTPGSPALARDVELFLKSLNEVYSYRMSALLDPRGRTVLSRSRMAGEAPDEETARRAAGAAARGEIVFGDLEWAGSGGAIRLDLFVPIKPAGADGSALGVLVMRVDPADFLFPLIQTWPMSSPSAETLLIRREGDEVVFLNELRHRQGTALRLRLPVSDPDLPAARIARGEPGEWTGVDYRGVPVLSAVRPIPQSPWFMVAKVDLAEIRAPLRRNALLMGAVVLMAILASGFGLGWQARRARVELHQRSEAEIRRLNLDLEKRVAERTAQLRASNAELEAFSYSVSHDLRAPLRIIDGFSQAVLEEYESGLDEQGRTFLRRIRANAQAMGLLIDDMLKLARVTKADLHIQEIDLSRLAGEAVATLAAAWPQRGVSVVIAPGLKARGDERLLRIVLDNLFDNAWKFTAGRAKARIEFGAAAVDGEQAYFVRDDGVGFDMTYAGKLFGAFQRLHPKSEFPGTGIGLATIRRIVHRHGGRVWAESVVDQGAAFFFTLDVGKETPS